MGHVQHVWAFHKTSRIQHYDFLTRTIAMYVAEEDVRKSTRKKNNKKE